MESTKVQSRIIYDGKNTLVFAKSWEACLLVNFYIHIILKTVCWTASLNEGHFFVYHHFIPFFHTSIIFRLSSIFFSPFYSKNACRVDANLKRTKRNRLLKEGNDEIIFRRDEYSFNTIMHKHVYIYMNMHSYTYIS